MTLNNFTGFYAIGGPDGGQGGFTLGWAECDPTGLTEQDEEIEQIRQATVRLNRLTGAPW